MTLYDVTQQYEILYNDPADPRIKIRRCLKYSGKAGEADAGKQSKIVIVNSNVAKIDWHAWNGFKHVIYDGFVCLLCQITLKKPHLLQHSQEPEHLNGIEGFLQQYLPGLVRTVSGFSSDGRGGFFSKFRRDVNSTVNCQNDINVRVLSNFTWLINLIPNVSISVLSPMLIMPGCLRNF